MNNKPSPGLIVVMASGAVAFLFSFFDFFEETSSWDLGPGIWLPLLGLAAAVLAAVRAFAAQVNMPERVLTFTIPQILVAIGLITTFIVIGFLFLGSDSRGNFEVGFFFEFLASIGLLVGGLLELVGRQQPGTGYGAGYGAPEQFPGQQQPQPGYPPQQPWYPPQAPPQAPPQQPGYPPQQPPQQPPPPQQPGQF